MSKRIVEKLEAQPDVWMQITVPNEFQRAGKFNIGLTAGMETTLVHQTWIEGCNRMDIVLNSSNHSKKVFQVVAATPIIFNLTLIIFALLSNEFSLKVLGTSILIAGFIQLVINFSVVIYFNYFPKFCLLYTSPSPRDS